MGIWGSLLDAIVTNVLQIPLADLSVGGVPSRWGWSDTAIPTQSLQVTGKGTTGWTSIDVGRPVRPGSYPSEEGDPVIS